MREAPDIDQLKRQARELLEAYRAQSPDAVTEVTAHHRTAMPKTFALHDAQFVLARSYGFESWPKLKAAVDGLERIDWPRDDPRWFWMLWRPLPGHEDLTDAEQADCGESFRLILQRCDPNLRAGESGQTMLHEVIARDHDRCRF
jgi:hypothetical protein